MNPFESIARSSRPAAATGLVLVLLPFATVLWVHRAAAAPQAGDLDSAISTQLERVAQQPASPEVHNDLGNLLALAQDREAAEAAYREALRLDADYFSALFNLAVLLRTGHRPQEAIQVLDRAVELEPDSAWSYYQRGAAHQELGHRKQATRDYARAFALDHRLALPDVNPLVIGNPLVTAAMLTPQNVPVADVTPRSYAEPGRISHLLLPPPPPPPTEAGATTEPTPGTPAAANVQQPAPPAVGEVRPPASGEEAPAISPLPTSTPPVEGDDDEQPRRITVDDVRSLRILNQSSPEGQAVPPPEGGSRQGVDLQAPQRFRPGRRSSAQLDLRLLPGGASSGDRLASAVTPARR
jgi:hypothetical protein